MTKSKPKEREKKKGILGDMQIDTKLLIADHIKEELNKLFYLKPDYDAEMEMLKYQYDHEEEERLGLHASAITGATKSFCYREQVISVLYRDFKLAGKKIPKKIANEFNHKQGNHKHSTSLLRIFEEGKSIGTKWQRLFIRGKLGVKEDMDISRMQEDYDLSYTPDGVIVLDGKKYVVEIKSQNTFAFQKAKSHPSGQKQLKLYMYFEGIDRGFVLVDDKNTSDFKIFLEMNVNESDPDIADALYHLENIQRLKRKTLKTKKFPECTCGKCLVKM